MCPPGGVFEYIDVRMELGKSSCLPALEGAWFQSRVRIRVCSAVCAGRKLIVGYWFLCIGCVLCSGY